MNDDLISRKALKKAMWDESYTIATFTECGAEVSRLGLTITEIEHIINNAPPVEPELSDEQIEKITDLLETEWGYEGIREDVSRILRGGRE